MSLLKVAVGGRGSTMEVWKRSRMGLSIHWEFETDTDPPGARRLVYVLHAAAQGAGFTEVGPVIEAWADRRPADGDETTAPAAAEQAAVDRAWVMSQGLMTLPGVEVADRPRRVAPVHVAAFRAYSQGAEEAVFGLASYREKLSYVWSAGCATQGSARRGGVPAFLKAHRAVIAVLDKARSVGVKVRARDDGHFWETRDPKQLIDCFDEWEMLCAALRVGRRTPSAACLLAADIRPVIDAKKRQITRRDREPVEGLEG